MINSITWTNMAYIPWHVYRVLGNSHRLISLAMANHLSFLDRLPIVWIKIPKFYKHRLWLRIQEWWDTAALSGHCQPLCHHGTDKRQYFTVIWANIQCLGKQWCSYKAKIYNENRGFGADQSNFKSHICHVPCDLGIKAFHLSEL